MLNVKKLITGYKTQDFSEKVEKSNEAMKRYKEENVFHSNTINEMLSNRFEYKGNRPNTIFVKNLENNKPLKVRVKIAKELISKYDTIMHEAVSLRNDSGELIGKKTYTIKRLKDGGYKMEAGDMDNYKSLYGGVGFRLDQIQIERALQLGITKIPRDALAKATLYHTKMGFLPTEKLVEIKSQKALEKLQEKRIKLPENDDSFNSIEPILTEKDGKFYLDINKTQALVNLENCKRIIKQTHEHRILEDTTVPTSLELKGEELQHWKEILKDHQILPKLNFELPEY